MKYIAALLLDLAPLWAEEAPTVQGDPALRWDVELPQPVVQDVGEPAPVAKPIDFEVLSSRTKHVEVSQAPEMADLPPVEGTIAMTIQKVANPELPAPPPPLRLLPPEDPAVVARLQELRETYKITKLVLVSATVYDHNRTLVRIYPNGRVDEEAVAWSNLDFNHFSGKFGTYRVKDSEGSFQDVALLM